jgi:hypothetical protein
VSGPVSNVQVCAESAAGQEAHLRCPVDGQSLAALQRLVGVAVTSLSGVLPHLLNLADIGAVDGRYGFRLPAMNSIRGKPQFWSDQGSRWGKYVYIRNSDSKKRGSLDRNTEKKGGESEAGEPGSAAARWGEGVLRDQIGGQAGGWAGIR